MKLRTQKLRIYAMLLRLQELEIDRLTAVANQQTKAAKRLQVRPFVVEQFDMPDILVDSYDKKGRPFQSPKSKYHK